ncbi:MAG: ArsR/SmtB family transcription factor [Candidatus Saccharicenans sp.]|nr:MAG: transcriptional regulator [Candidatus Aminicenantes bacterium]HEK86834.1 ArsR family transcriptional regulator [Candidatus Aminicenantes bacterium]
MRKYKLNNINKVLAALAEQNRLRILAALSFRKMAVCEIRALLKLSFSTVSKHLSILKEAGLIDFEKDGKWVIYRVNKDFPLEIKKILNQVLSFISEDEQIKEDLKTVRSLDRDKICSITATTSKPIITNRRNKP